MAAVDSLAYKKQAELFWEQAQEELANGDLRQASEKGWGAAAQMVKAVAEHRGLEHNGHRELFGVVSGLQNEELTSGFGLANSLHSNFYEGWMDSATVKLHLDRVGDFLKTLRETELDGSIDAGT